MDIDRVAKLIDDRPGDGVFRVHADAYTSAEIFRLEQEHIFKKSWCFLGLEAQIGNPDDFFTTHISDTPILVTRNRSGGVSAFLNACRHKGVMLCTLDTGNQRSHTCPYHGWAYDSDGHCIGIKAGDYPGAYGAAFRAESHDLIPLPALGSYRGMIFGSLRRQSSGIAAYLGDMAPLLDLVLDQGPNGMEFVPGRSAYTYKGNWKLQLDNGLDYYHLSSAHISYLKIIGERSRKGKGNLAANSADWTKRMQQRGGMFAFDNGHAALWIEQPQPEKRPIHRTIAEISRRVGEVKAEWMLKPRQYSIFPNLQIADSSTTVLRTFRPLRPDLTEMNVYCLAPIGEAAETRSLRLRQYEDFFSASGLATPDDSVLYERCQAGMASGDLEWLQGYMRGIELASPGATPESRELGIRPIYQIAGDFDLQNEVAFHPALRQWRRLLVDSIGGAAR